MKKRIMAVLTVSVCAVMCASVFMIPGFAAGALAKEQGTVLEKDVPREYMTDFITVAHAAEDNDIILTEDQLDGLVTIIRQKCGDMLDLDLPADLEFEYDAYPAFHYNYEGEIVNIAIRAHGTEEQQNVTVNALFVAPEFPDGQAEFVDAQINSINNGINGAYLQEIFGEKGLDVLHALTATAEEGYVKDFGIEISEGLEYEYSFFITTRAYGYEGEVVNVTIQAEDDKKGISYVANFAAVDFLNKSTELKTLRASGDVNSGLHENFENLGLEALKNELDLTVPDDYDLFTYFYSTYENGQPHVQLTCEWRDDDAEHDIFDKSEGGTYSFSSKERYDVTFDKLDLSERTGRITGVEMFVEFTQWSLMEEWAAPGYVGFTEDQLNDMLEAAKRFLNEKEIGFGDLGRSLQITINEKPAMYFQFGQDEKNDSPSPSVFITITPDLKVLGYSY